MRIISNRAFIRVLYLLALVSLVSSLTISGCSKSEEPLSGSGIAPNAAPGKPSQVVGSDTVIQGFESDFSVTASDPDGDSLTLVFLWGDGDSSLVALPASDSVAEAGHSYSSLGSYRIYAVAMDPAGLRSDSSDVFRIYVLEPGPLPTAAPTGADTVFIDTFFTFSASTYNPLGFPFQLMFEWGDGTPNTTTAFDTGNAHFSALHIYTDTGEFSIRARGIDTAGNQSRWSAPKIVQVINRAPQTPGPPVGDTLQVAGTLLQFKSSTIDPEGDDLRMTFFWGDGEFTVTLLDHHLTEFTKSHIFEDTGMFQVRTVATDVHGNESDTSQALNVHLPSFKIDTIVVTDSGVSKQFAFAKSDREGIMFLHRDVTLSDHRFVEQVWNLFDVSITKNQLSQTIYPVRVGNYDYKCLIHPDRTSEQGVIQITP